MSDEATTREDELIALAAAGDGAAWGALLTAHQERLTKMVAFRMDSRLSGRIDAADVVQDAFVEASAHRNAYFRAPMGPLYLWLRGVVSNKLLELHRHHLSIQMRDAKREQQMAMPSDVHETTAALCWHLAGNLTSPSVAAARLEISARLAEALEAMDPTDRELLAMRHFEQLTSAEAANLLGIQERTAAKRYLRALKKLKDILSEMPGGLTELRP